MATLSTIEATLGQMAPDQLRRALTDFLPKDASMEERVRAIEVGLQSPMGKSLREAMARWIVDEIVPVESLVPEAYLKWRPPVRDAMMFVVARLSPARLAPKLLEQLELPPNTPSEVRLLRLIAKVPGLQKLGQVIARNQHLRPALRKALAQLENGIRDVQPEDIRNIIQQGLGNRLKSFEVELATGILSEASVSAVVRFTWRPPEGGARQRGVFKVLKPHIPDYFAEDMDYLEGLAHYFGDQHHTYGFPPHLIPDTFKKVRRLLQHEVNFAREQKTLAEAAELYRNMRGVRIPQLIKPLCTPRITALSEEKGIKVTNAACRLPAARRGRVAQRIVEALVAVPLLSAHPEAIFHGDPHAGNLLYNSRTDELTIIDWALRERLSREQRRHLTLLFLTVTMRDPVGACNEVLALTQASARDSRRNRMVRETVNQFLDEMPVRHIASPVDAMKLLECIAISGVRFPGALIMLSKVMFTLDGILHDIGGSDSGMGFTIARHVARHWVSDRKAFRSPLDASDWLTLQCGAMLLASRLWLVGEKAVLDLLLPANRYRPAAEA
jgi:ubiquinone biosynthesis protein